MINFFGSKVRCTKGLGEAVHQKDLGMRNKLPQAPHCGSWHSPAAVCDITEMRKLGIAESGSVMHEASPNQRHSRKARDSFRSQRTNDFCRKSILQQNYRC